MFIADEQQKVCKYIDHWDYLDYLDTLGFRMSRYQA